MREKRLLLDCAARQIIWPDDLPALAKFSPTIQLSRQAPLSGRIDPKIQADAERRNRLLEKEEKRYRILHKNWGRSDQTPPASVPTPLPTPSPSFQSKSPSAKKSVRFQLTTAPATDFVSVASIQASEDQALINALVCQVESHERFEQWNELEPLMPRDPVQLEPSSGLDQTVPNFIEPDPSPHAASVLFAPKPNTTARRFCIDYRWMNDHLKSRITPAPSLEGTAFGCREAQRFTKIDVIQAFHRLRMDPDSEYLTAFRTRFGTFRWKVLPFGLKVGPAWFQQFINAQLHDLLDRFNVTKVDYLGVLLEAGVGLSVDPRKVRSIQDWKFEDLRDRTAIRSFVGLCNFIRVFCYHASGVAEPLNRLLKKDVAFVMGPEQREAFDQLKRLAIEAPVLAFFRPELPTRLETDASRNATAGVLWQEQPDQTWKPVGFFSKTMTPAERAYPIQDRELLAVVQSLEHFYPELLGQKFDVITDHEALVHFSTKRLLSVRQIRWSDFLAQFDIRFLYRPGRLNVVADALSRKTAELPTVKAREAEERTVTLIPPERLGFATDSLDPTAAGNLPPQNFSPEPKPTRPLVLRATSALQTPEDRGIQQTPDQDRPELDPNSVPKGAELVSLIRQENLLQDLGTHGTHLVVPAQTSDKQTFLQTALIREAHEPQIFAHAGQNKVIKLLQRDFYWPRMKEDIRRYIRNCHDCRRNKTPRDKTPGLLHPLPVPTSVWEHVECDGKDMPKDRYGYDYVWTFVCKLSRIIATLPGKKNDTAEVLASRYFRYLYRFFEINRLTGTKHRHGSSLHPQTQGGVEVTNQYLDQKLRFYVTKHQDNWSSLLPALDFAHNSSWHSSIDMAPLKTAQETQEDARNAATAAQERQKEQANRKRRPTDFAIGPFVILEERGHSYVLQLPESYKMKNLFHADRLRKAADNPLPQQIQSPPPPEEINGEPEWEVDQVQQSRVTGRSRRLEYQVLWKGCDPDETWYPARNFRNAPMALKIFHDEHPDAAGPPVNLQYWIECAAAEEGCEERDDDDTAEKAVKPRTRRHD
ncbi:reverse transcriptase (RNA-dependent DNA polymerase) [Hirsutella rhossiliensis]